MRLTAAELLRRAAMRWEHGDQTGAREDWNAAGELGGWHLCCPHRERFDAVISAVLDELSAKEA